MLFIIYIIQFGFQAIHFAAGKGHTKVIELLVDTYGVDPRILTKVRAVKNAHISLVINCISQPEDLPCYDMIIQWVGFWLIMSMNY